MGTLINAIAIIIASIIGLMFKSKLNIQAEFSTNHQIEFRNGAVAQIHLDFMQKPPERKLEIVGDKRKLYFDYYKNQISIVNRNGTVKKLIEKNAISYMKLKQKAEETYVDNTNSTNKIITSEEIKTEKIIFISKKCKYFFLI